MEAKTVDDMSERLAEIHRAVAETERRNEALVRLQEASVGLLSVGEAPSHDRLIEILCHVTGAPRGVYWLLDGPAAGVLGARGTYGVRRTPRNDTDRRMQELLLRVELASDHPVARAARTMSPVALTDTEADRSWAELSSLWGRTGIRSLLGVPGRRGDPAQRQGPDPAHLGPARPVAAADRQAGPRMPPGLPRQPGGRGRGDAAGRGRGAGDRPAG